MERDGRTFEEVEKIINSLNGLDEYDELSKTDIDELIKSFRQLEEKVNG